MGDAEDSDTMAERAEQALDEEISLIGTTKVKELVVRQCVHCLVAPIPGRNVPKNLLFSPNFSLSS